MGGKQKNKNSTNTENNSLKKKQRPHNALPNVIPNTGTVAAKLRLLDLGEPVHICLRLLATKQTAPSWTEMHGKTSISLWLTWLNCI